MAADRADITYRTLMEWFRRAREGEEPYTELLEAIEVASEEMAAEALMVVGDAIREGNLAAATWYLERAQPDKWGRRRLEVTGKDGKDLSLTQVAIVALPNNGRGDRDNVVAIDADYVDIDKVRQLSESND